MPEATEDDVAKAKEILAAAVAAHGGLDKLQAVKNTVAQSNGTVHTPGGKMDLQVSFYHSYPDKFRQELDTPQGKVSYVYDGEAAFAMSPTGTQPLPPEMVTSLIDTIFRDTIPLLTNLTQNDIPVQYAGTEKVLGEPASVLIVKQPSGEMLKLFISENTHHVVKNAFRDTVQGVTVNKETVFSDYRDVNGIKVAYHFVQNINGEPYTESRINSVKLNAELDDSLFEVPE